MLFVAEIGLNHDGNFDLAHELVRQAKLSGADIAKFQFGWRDGPDGINRIDPARARRLKEVCDYYDIEFMASVISDAAFDLAAEVKPHRFKIASRTVKDNPKLVERVIAEGKETFVSLGFWEGQGWPFGAPTAKLRYIHCVSKYPTYPHEARSMPARFSPESHYGYSDHMLGIEGCLLAISRGAQYVEKHLTLNKASQVIRDHTLSATPQEFRTLTELGRPLAKLAAEIPAR